MINLINKKNLRLAVLVGGLSLSPIAHANDAALLGTSLTPLGSDPAASADGTIPAWTGGLTTPPAGYVKGQDHIDPYADDEMVMRITAENVDQHKDKLTPGQIALFERHPESFWMDIYPTRRSCSLPQFVYDATKRNAEKARLTNDGNGVEDAYVGVPFPVPKSAVEIYWNHNFHWHGTGFTPRLRAPMSTQMAASPRLFAKIGGMVNTPTPNLLAKI